MQSIVWFTIARRSFCGLMGKGGMERKRIVVAVLSYLHTYLAWPGYLYAIVRGVLLLVLLCERGTSHTSALRTARGDDGGSGSSGGGGRANIADRRMVLVGSASHTEEHNLSLTRILNGCARLVPWEHHSTTLRPPPRLPALPFRRHRQSS